MAKIVSFSNQSLLDKTTEDALINSPVVAGSSKTIVLNDNSDFADDDYVLVGNIGDPKSEISQINATVVAGTDIQVDALTFPHNRGVKIWKIPYNQVKLYHATTLTGDKTIIGSAHDLDPDNEFTDITETTKTAGYYFFQLYNSATEAASGYSPAIPYAGVPSTTRTKIRDLVKSFYSKPIETEIFNTLADNAEQEIFARRRWRFREATATFKSVEDQQAYDIIDDAEITDFGQLAFATYDDEFLYPIKLKQHKALNIGTITANNPRCIFEWAGSFYLTSTPDADDKEVEIMYYKNAGGFDDDGTETPVKLPQAIAYRILEDLWAMEDTGKAGYFSGKFNTIMKLMEIDDKKQVSRFSSLTDSRLDNVINDPIENSNISV